MKLENENTKNGSLKKTRIGKPKVRTGCKTCKTRRVKCGEEKPCCLRCSQSGYKCDGYQINSVEKTRRKKLPRLLIPKARILPTQPVSSLNYSPRCDSTVITSMTKPQCNCFELLNKLEYSSILSSSSSSPGENRQPFASIPRFPLSPPFSYKINENLCTASQKISILSPKTYATTLNSLNNCVMKTSKTHNIYLEEEKKDFSFCDPRSIYQRHACACLLRRVIDGFQFEIHCTFFGCLLFLIFENFNLYRDEREKDELNPSLFQVATSIRKIREWVTGTPQDSALTPSSNYFVERQNHTSIIESNDLQNADALLKTLESHVASIAESRTREKYAKFWRQSEEATLCIPETWFTLDEARKSLIEVVERNQNWLISNMYLNFSEETQQFSLAIHSFCCSLLPRLSHPDIYLSLPTKAAGRVQMLEELSRWNSAFQPLLNASHMSYATQSNFLIASILRMQWLASWIVCADESIGGDGINTKKGVKKWTIEFSELSDIADILLREWPSHLCHKSKSQDKEIVDFDVPHPQKTFRHDTEDENEDWFSQYWLFTLPFLVPLITIAWHYRHRSLRTLTIKFLNHCLDQDSSTREGIKERYMMLIGRSKLNGQIMSKILTWLFSIEEESWRLGITESPIFPSNKFRHCECGDNSSIGCDFSSRVSTRNINESSIVNETKVKSDYIPDWARANHISMSYVDEGKGIKVGCFQAVGYLGCDIGHWRDIFIPL